MSCFFTDFSSSDSEDSEDDLGSSESEVSKNPVFKPVSSPSHSVDDNDNIDDDADNTRESLCDDDDVIDSFISSSNELGSRLIEIIHRENFWFKFVLVCDSESGQSKMSQSATAGQTMT